jgi:catechol 2,3-dioxygenase-like lactoylglutathione lyase family enzyme
MPARFHEISISTPDIGASVDFYERLGFWQAPTGDVWPHRYGVVTDGRMVLGLHEVPDFAAITFIHPEVAQVAETLDRTGVPLTLRQTDPEVFNRIEFADPADQAIRVLAARTFSPADHSAERQSACGYFAHYSMPAKDSAAVAAFWEPLGFVAMPEEADPYPHQSLTSDGINLALHSPRLLPAMALVFCEEGMAAKISSLRDAGVEFDASLPRGLAADSNALLEAPEGTLLLLLTGTL